MNCRDCGASVPASETTCWLCQGRPGAAPTSSRPVPAEPVLLGGVALAMLLVGVGAAVSTPGLLLLGLVVTLPLLVRACTRKTGVLGTRGTGSLSVVLAVLLAATAAFLTACGTLR